LQAERQATVPSRPARPRSASRAPAASSADPLPLLLDLYERHGPVFTVRVLHGNSVFALGPEANHHILVANAANYLWREGHMGDLMPLLGDGLLTIDGDFHRRSRRIMLPPSTVSASRPRARRWIRDRGGRRRHPADDAFDLYAWTRGWRCASPCARSSAWTPTAPGRRARRRARRSRRAGVLFARLPPADPARPAHALGADARRAREARRADPRRDRPAARDGRARRGPLSLLLDAEDEDGGRLPTSTSATR
jgi:hypothetical protein